MERSYQRSAVKGCCKDCQERFPACHDVCATYLKAKAEYEQEKEIIKESRQKFYNYANFHYERVSETKRYLSSKKGSKR